MTVKREPLQPGDTLDVAITISEGYQSVRYGVTIQIRNGESTKAAQKRAEDFVFEHAQRVLEELTE